MRGVSALIAVTLVSLGALATPVASATCAGQSFAPRPQTLSFCRQHRPSTCCTTAIEHSVIKSIEPYFSESRAVVDAVNGTAPVLPEFVTQFTVPFPPAPIAPAEVELYRYSVPAACRAYASAVLCARCSPELGTGAYAGVCVRTCQDWLDACSNVLFRPDPDVPGAILPCPEQTYVKASFLSTSLNSDDDEDDDDAFGDAAGSSDTSVPSVAFYPVSSEQVTLETKALVSALTASDPAAALALLASQSGPVGPALPLACAPLRSLLSTGPELCAAYGVDVADPLDTHADLGPLASTFISLYASYRSLTPSELRSPARAASTAAAAAAAAGAGTWPTKQLAVVTGQEAAASLSTAGLLLWTAGAPADDGARTGARTGAHTGGSLRGMSDSDASAVLAVVAPALAQPLLPPGAAPALGQGQGQWAGKWIETEPGAAAAPAHAHAAALATVAMLRDVAAAEEALAPPGSAAAAAATAVDSVWSWRLPRQARCWDAAGDPLLGEWLRGHRAGAPQTQQPPTPLLSLATFKTHSVSRAVAAAAETAAAAEAASASALSPRALAAAFSGAARAWLRQTRAAVQQSALLPRALRQPLLRALSGHYRFAIAHTVTGACLLLVLTLFMLLLRGLSRAVCGGARAQARRPGPLAAADFVAHAASAGAGAGFDPISSSSVFSGVGSAAGGGDATAGVDADPEAAVRAARLLFLAAQRPSGLQLPGGQLRPAEGADTAPAVASVAAPGPPPVPIPVPAPASASDLASGGADGFVAGATAPADGKST